MLHPGTVAGVAAAVMGWIGLDYNIYARGMRGGRALHVDMRSDTMIRRWKGFKSDVYCNVC